MAEDNKIKMDDGTTIEAEVKLFKLSESSKGIEATLCLYPTDKRLVHLIQLVGEPFFLDRVNWTMVLGPNDRTVCLATLVFGPASAYRGIIVRKKESLLSRLIRSLFGETRRFKKRDEGEDIPSKAREEVQE